MGKTGKYLMVILFSVSIPGKSQDSDFKRIDSVTYSYYIDGKWDELIRETEAALKSGYDYKFLRQRAGYAYFSKGDYYNSRKYFYKALQFDSYDQFTLRYLWWSAVNTGKEDYAGSLANAMYPELRQALSVRKFKPVESIDLETNFKFTNSGFRTGAVYYRVGVTSRLGYRLRLYQSFSDYSQKISVDFTPSAEQFAVTQPGYYAGINWNVSSGTLVRGSFNFFKTNSGANIFRGYLFQAGFAPDLNRFILELDGSFLKWNAMQVWQPELHLGYVFPGKSSFYLKGSVAWLLKDLNNRVYSPRAGLRLLKNAWLEVNADFGKMDLYNDFNGLYVYNSYDPIIMRAGASYVYYINNKISFWLNYSVEKKEYYNYSSKRFNQYSYLGGLKWKL